MTKLEVIGKFRYREPKIRQVTRAKENYPIVTVYGDLALQPLFSYVQQAINTQVTLKHHREHQVVIEQVDGRLRLTIDHKRILMLELP